MKKGTKMMLVIAGVFAAAGIGLSAAGAVMGADVGVLVREVRDRLGYDVGEMAESRDDNLEKDYRNKIYENTALPGLDVELAGDNLILKAQEGEDIRIEVAGEDAGNIRVTENDKKISVKSIKKSKKSRIVIISYPSGHRFTDTEIGLGAGRMAIENDFRTDHLDISIGAGDFVNSGKIETKEAELEVGAGTMVLTNLAAEKLDGECGIGTMDLRIEGREADFNYDLECGIGRLSVGGTEYSGIGKERKISNPGAAGSMTLDCGIGELLVTFTEG